MNKEIFYQYQNATHGPISADTLIELIRAGTLDGANAIWRPGQQDWQRSDACEDLRPYLRPSSRPNSQTSGRRGGLRSRLRSLTSNLMKGPPEPRRTEAAEQEPAPESAPDKKESVVADLWQGLHSTPDPNERPVYNPEDDQPLPERTAFQPAGVVTQTRRGNDWTRPFHVEEPEPAPGSSLQGSLLQRHAQGLLPLWQSVWISASLGGLLVIGLFYAWSHQVANVAPVNRPIWELGVLGGVGMVLAWTLGTVLRTGYRFHERTGDWVQPVIAYLMITLPAGYVAHEAYQQRATIKQTYQQAMASPAQDYSIKTAYNETVLSVQGRSHPV